MKIQNNKKGVELTLQTIAIFILVIIVMIMIISFFTTHYGDGADRLFDVGNSTIESAKNYK